MSRGRAAGASRSRYRRSGASTAPRHTFLIVTEGAKTEPNYFRALRNALRLSSVRIEISHSTQTDPVGLTQYAIKLRDSRDREARNSDGVRYDEVWVVFDLEEPAGPRRAQAHQARQLPRAKGIQFAVSDPCFEYFLLLHYESTTMAFSDCADVTKRLTLSWAGYAKGGPLPTDLLARMPNAVGRAKTVREAHTTTGGPNSPSTDVDRLLVQLAPAILSVQKS